MNKCNSCGANNNATSNFCETCGNKLTPVDNRNAPHNEGVGPNIKNTHMSHGVSIIIGAFVLLLIIAGQLTEERPSQEQLDQALGALFIFGCWIIPHSIWLFGINSSNKVLPTVALVILGMCGMIYVGSLPH